MKVLRRGHPVGVVFNGSNDGGLVQGDDPSVHRCGLRVLLPSPDNVVRIVRLPGIVPLGHVPQVRPVLSV